MRRAYKWAGSSMVFLFVLIAAYGISFAASFDCNKASSQIEKAICGDEGLSSIDEQLGQAYRQVLEASSDKNAIKSDHREWLNKRNQVTNPAELMAIYQERIEELHAILENSGAAEQNQAAQNAQDAVQQQVLPEQKTPIDSRDSITTANSTKSEKQKSAGLNFKDYLIIFAIVLLFGIFIYFFGALKVFGWFIFMLGVIFRASLLTTIGRGMKDRNSNNGGKNFTSLLAQPQCKGTNRGGMLCNQGLIKCPKCSAIGCSHIEGNSCSNQKFINHKCLLCGAPINEGTDWLPG
jgi:uncharacterized protein